MAVFLLKWKLDKTTTMTVQMHNQIAGDGNNVTDISESD